MDVEDYIKRAQKQSSDARNHQKLNIHITEFCTVKVAAVIINYKDTEQISSKMVKSLIPDNVKAPVMLPNVHKHNNSGRPVISFVDCHTNRISEFVDYYLQPAVANLKSYLKARLTSLKK